MNKSFSYKIDIVIPIILFSLYFFSAKNVVSIYYYIILCILINLTYFPLRILLQQDILKLYIRISIVIFIIITILSIFVLFYQAERDHSICISILGIINILYGFYWIFKLKMFNYFVLHFLYSLLLAAMKL